MIPPIARDWYVVANEESVYKWGKGIKVVREVGVYHIREYSLIAYNTYLYETMTRLKQAQ